MSLLASTARMPGPLLPFGPAVAAIAFVLVAPMVTLPLRLRLVRASFRLGFSALPCRFCRAALCCGSSLRATALTMPGMMMVAAATLTAFFAAVAARSPDLFVFNSSFAGRSLVPGCRNTLRNLAGWRRCNISQRVGRRSHGLRNQGRGPHRRFGREGAVGWFGAGYRYRLFADVRAGRFRGPVLRGGVF